MRLSAISSYASGYLLNHVTMLFDTSEITVKNMLKIGSEKPKGTEIANRTRLSVKSAVRKIDSIEQYENFLQRNSRKPCRNAEFKSYAHFLQPFIKLAKKYKINTYIKNKAGKQEKRGTEKQLRGNQLHGKQKLVKTAERENIRAGALEGNLWQKLWQKLCREFCRKRSPGGENGNLRTVNRSCRTAVCKLKANRGQTVNPRILRKLQASCKQSADKPRANCRQAAGKLQSD